ncbi:MAG: TIGR00730 family Rossman fold protein [Flavisolibacter sp.]
MSQIKRIAVFCGSKLGTNKVYADHAKEVAGLLADREIELIYGGGNKGLMGLIADSVMKKGGTVKGIIPQVLVNWEHQHEKISELLVVEDMHIRKRKMYDFCEGAIILPGGLGTLDELFEMLTWNQLSIHNKLVFILNSAGFYDSLLAHLKHLSAEGFLYNDPEKMFILLHDPKDLLTYL